MSRIGRKPIVIPAGVTVTVDEAAHSVTVKGPKGSLNSNYHPLMTVKVEGNEVLVTRPNDEPEARSLHGLTRSNIANMVNGVVNGYEKKLEIVGVGLRCQKQGSNLVMNLGFSHQVNIPDTEDCTIVWQDPNHFTVTVKGPKGSLNSNYHPLMTVKVEGNEVLVTRPNDEPKARSLHGLTRTNIANMVNGVVNGYEKKLEIVGVGMRCQKQGSNLVMNLGFSHQVNIPDTEDCTIVWQDPNHFSVTGIDKQKVGQYAAEIRGKKPPEPYKGKGIRYAGEVVKHKEGKAGKGKK